MLQDPYFIGFAIFALLWLIAITIALIMLYCRLFPAKEEERFIVPPKVPDPTPKPSPKPNRKLEEFEVETKCIELLHNEPTPNNGISKNRFSL